MSAPAPTHVYIVGYSDGVVKVGRTSNPGQRNKALSSEGRRRGAHITHQWEKPATNPELAEFMLREFGRTRAEKAWGDEYFRYPDAAEFIERASIFLTFGIGENFNDEAWAIARDIDPTQVLSDLFAGRAA